MTDRPRVAKVVRRNLIHISREAAKTAVGSEPLVTPWAEHRVDCRKGRCRVEHGQPPQVRRGSGCEMIAECRNGMARFACILAVSYGNRTCPVLRRKMDSGEPVRHSASVAPWQCAPLDERAVGSLKERDRL